jgi:diadenosine tetraphosphate (Ap4A) HIT family hydrolase
MTFLLDPALENSSFLLCDLKLSQLRLHNNSLYKWLVLIPKINGAVEITDLTPEQQHELLKEINIACQILQTLFSPHKLNIAALGNVTKQLHIHVLARETNDPTYPDPVWGNGKPGKMYTPSESVKLISKIQQHVDVIHKTTNV